MCFYITRILSILEKPLEIRKSMRPATLLKKEALAQVFSREFL